MSGKKQKLSLNARESLRTIIDRADGKLPREPRMLDGIDELEKARLVAGCDRTRALFLPTKTGRDYMARILKRSARAALKLKEGDK